MTEKKFGPKPLLVDWTLQAVLIPMLTYGAVVWGNSKMWKYQKIKLQRLLRHSFIAMAPMRRGTPQAALEIIFNKMPLDMVIQKHGLLGYLRVKNVLGISWPGTGKGGKVGFMKSWSALAAKLKVDRVAEECIPLKFNWNRYFTVGTHHFEQEDNIKVFIAYEFNSKNLRLGMHVDVYIGKAIKPDLQRRMSFLGILPAQGIKHCLAEINVMVRTVLDGLSRSIQSIDICFK